MEKSPFKQEPFRSFTLEELGGRDYDLKRGIPGWLPGWPELNEALGNEMDRHLRFFHPIEYSQRDPELIHKYQDIVERLQKCIGEPFMSVQPNKEDTRINMGLVDNAQIQFYNSGQLYVTSKNAQWVIADSITGEACAEISQSIVSSGSVIIESVRKSYCGDSPIWQKDRQPLSDDPARQYIDEEPTEIYIGRAEIEAYKAANPALAAAVDDMLRAYELDGINLAVATKGFNDDLFLSGVSQEELQELASNWQQAGGSLGQRP